MPTSTDHPAEPADAVASTAPGATPAHAILLLLVLLATLGAGAASRGTTPPAGEEAPSSVFSAERAAEAVAPVVEEPRPVGSPAVDRAQEELAAEIGRASCRERV